MKRIADYLDPQEQIEVDLFLKGMIPFDILEPRAQAAVKASYFAIKDTHEEGGRDRPFSARRTDEDAVDFIGEDLDHDETMKIYSQMKNQEVTNDLADRMGSNPTPTYSDSDPQSIGAILDAIIPDKE